MMNRTILTLQPTDLNDGPGASTGRCSSVPQHPSRSAWRAISALASLQLLCAAPAAWAAEVSPRQQWPQWRGPLGIGVAPEGNPPTAWSESNHIKWKVKIPGHGTSTPIVWGDQVFLTTAIPTGKKIESPAEPAAPAPTPAPAENARPGGGRRPGGGMRAAKPTEVHQFVLLCLDRETGKVLWQQTAREEVPHEAHHRTEGSFASSSPVTDGRHVLAYFGSRGLHCYDLQGKPQWSQDFGDMRIVMSFGEGSSPALYQDTVVVNWDQEGECFIIALDKNNGQTRWKKSRDERTSWATPLILEAGGKVQVITAASGRIRSYDLANGDLIWECSGLTRNVIPTPVAGDGLVYVTSGYQGNALLAIRLDRTGNLTGSDAIVWSYRKNTPYVPSPLLYQNRLYCFALNRETLSCFEAKTGKVLIDGQTLEALKGVYASPVGAGGKVYLVGRNGTTVVLKPSDTLEILATNRLEEKTDASPAVVGNQLFLRGREYLYCIAEK